MSKINVLCISTKSIILKGVKPIVWKQVERLETFNGVKLKGNETFDELLKIEQQVKEYKERKARIDEDIANIQRVDAQVKGVKKW